MEATIAVGAGVAGVVGTLIVLAVGLWLLRATLSLVRKLVVFSVLAVVLLGVVGLVGAAGWMASH